jgi:hypothetical protein
VLFEPGEERARGAVIGLARVAIADRGREEFEKTADGVITGTTALPETDTAVRGALIGTRSFMQLM